MIDYSALEKSLRHLERQWDNHQRTQQRSDLADLDREAIAESVIHRFETCYDTLWKGLKRHLIEDLGLTDVPNSPKPLFKLAGRNDLFSSSVEQWLRYADARIATSHDYSGTKAAQALLIIENFLNDARSLYQTMTGMPWR
ncbi:MAG: nucleotidyltransferase substrate binding protein [Magnetococcales bacterium]|nr:nucleotidyltransferase substrate binding protein [Magnetococcales bacterium]